MPNPNAEKPENAPEQHGEEYSSERDYDERDDYDDYVWGADEPQKLLSPEQKIQRAAVALLAAGWLCLGGSLLLLTYFVTNNIEAGLLKNANSKPSFGLLFSCASLLYFGLLTYGAHRMLEMRSWGWASFSAILAVLTVLFLGICGLAIGALGVWTLIILFRTDAQEVFRRKREEVVKLFSHDAPLQ